MEKNKKYVSDYPELLDEWDYDRNSDVNPSNVTSGSHQKIWWLCQKHKHSWQAIVKSRAKGVGCPYCAGLRISIGFNDLASQYPELAEEWDYSKNGDLKPTDVTHGTRKKYGGNVKSIIIRGRRLLLIELFINKDALFVQGEKRLKDLMILRQLIRI